MAALEGKVCVVTGAARGIGLAIATELTALGGTVVLSDIDEPTVREAATSLDRAEPAVCDVRDEAQVEQVLKAAAETHGSLDVVVASAGIGDVVPLAEMSFEQWREVMSINLDGVFLTSTRAARIMAGQGSGSIVNVASITGFAGSPGIGHYAAAKAAVINLTRTLNTEMRGLGLRVNAVCPGFINTTLVSDVADKFDALLPEGMDLDGLIQLKQSRWGEPEDVAKAVGFLAGDRAPWISGAALTLDGGFRASLL